MSHQLTLEHKDTKVVFVVEDYEGASVLRESFAVGDAPLFDDEDVASASKELLLLSLFAKHVSRLNKRVLTSILAYIEAAFLKSNDIHSLTATLDSESRATILSAYYETVSIIGRKLQPASLLTEPKVELYSVFGGQGVNETYYQEISNLYAAYPTLTTPLLQSASKHLSLLATKYRATLFYEHGLDVLSWLESEQAPSLDYLATCAVSAPLIGLGQFLQYVVYGKSQGLTPRELSQKFAGTTGHSQGIITALAVAQSIPDAVPTKEEYSFDAWAPFYDVVDHSLNILFQIGLQGSLSFPSVTVAPALVADCVENGEGVPSAMLSLNNVSLALLEQHVAAINKILVEDSGVADTAAPLNIGLYNGPRGFVVTGAPKHLVGLVTRLRKIKAPTGLDQTRVPHSKRLPTFGMRFLRITVPFHSQLLTGCSANALAELGPSEVAYWSKDKISLPVFDTFTGEDLRSYTGGDIITRIFDLIFEMPIHWYDKATVLPPSATHAIDFGMGGATGIGYICTRNWEGRGLRTITIGAKESTEAYSVEPVQFDVSWPAQYGPKLLQTANGRIHLDTPFSRLLSKPPLMVPGMTPTTVSAKFVAATLNAGYHIELAGGGVYNEKALRAKLAEVLRATKNTPGTSLSLNSLYINQRQWTFQFPLWCQLKKEGFPINGLTIGAGVPSSEKATEILDGLREAGIKHVSLKPGSVDGIRQVCTIARANPDFPIILQWTGGRAGGHHSCEDFHAPLLATYALIRRNPNIVLVVGSGFGGADDTYPYLTGEWSLPYGVERMPVDGFLFGSRVMVAQEAETSDSVKQLIIDAAGVEDSQWEQSYTKETGGIITVTSELGEPIHKIATRGVKLWAEFDKKIFALTKEKQLAYIKANKDYIVKRLNADYQKPWFPARSDGTPCDLEDMTYAEVTDRLVQLMYIRQDDRWIDPSLRNLTGDWLRRVEERLSNVNDAGVKVSVLQSYDSLNGDRLDAFLKSFNAAYPAARTQVLASADVAFFLAISQRRGQKPVPFIPILDERFSIWFKKDSLWQSEDIHSVVDSDPQRVCVLQGPVAVRYCVQKDEPIKDMLGGVEEGLIAKLLAAKYAGDKSKIPSADYLAPKPVAQTSDFISGISHTTETLADQSTKHTYVVEQEIDTDTWLAYLAGSELNWLQAFLSTESVAVEDPQTKGHMLQANPVRRVLAPRINQRIELVIDAQGQPSSLDVFN